MYMIILGYMHWRQDGVPENETKLHSKTHSGRRLRCDWVIFYSKSTDIREQAASINKISWVLSLQTGGCGSALHKKQKNLERYVSTDQVPAIEETPFARPIYTQFCDTSPPPVPSSTRNDLQYLKKNWLGFVRTDRQKHTQKWDTQPKSQADRQKSRHGAARQPSARPVRTARGGAGRRGAEGAREAQS